MAVLVFALLPGDAAAPGHAGRTSALARSSVSARRPSTSSAAASRPPFAGRAAQAVAYARSKGMVSSVAVLDTTTGSLSTAGNPRREYPSASVVKTLIAARLLLEGRMSGRTETLAWSMITKSDNDATDALYPLVGSAGLVPYLAAHYGIASLGSPPALGTWGSTRLTAAGLARFYNAVRHDHRVWPWLSNAMHHYEARTTADEPNDFGLAAAVPAAAVKNGWNEFRDPGHPNDAQINSTGYVDDRYAVVILSEGPASLYYTGGEAVVSAQARLLFP